MTCEICFRFGGCIGCESSSIVKIAIELPIRNFITEYTPGTKNKKTYLYEIQKGRCYICGEIIAKSKMTIDHIIPKSKGGTMRVDNIALACSDCNAFKSSSSIKSLIKRLEKRGQKKHSENLILFWEHFKDYKSKNL